MSTPTFRVRLKLSGCQRETSFSTLETSLVGGTPKRLNKIAAAIPFLKGAPMRCLGRGEFIIWGTPWNPWFHNWAFNLERGGEMAAVWAMVPEDVDILLTHTPPFQILDMVDNRHGRGSQGCEDLRNRMDEIAFIGDMKHRLHCFGHIHEGHGHEYSYATQWTYVNGSNCLWGLAHPPIVVEFDSVSGRYEVLEDESDWERPWA